MPSLQPYCLSLLRLAAGFTFALHGFQKLFGVFGGVGHGARAHFFSLLWLAAGLETVGGILIFLGLGTSAVAFLLCGEMAVAYFLQHSPKGLWPITNGGEPAVLYCFIFLFLFAAGPGPWSLDRIVRKVR